VVDFTAQPVAQAVRIAVHLAPSDGRAASGTFVATGLVSDSGVAPALERFAALRAGAEAPVVVHGADSFAGARGTIAIDYDGVFRPVARDLFSGKGLWRITGGDHRYEQLRGDGCWTATARFGPAGLTVDVIYEGSGRLA
jgi:hypothetical protein